MIFPRASRLTEGLFKAEQLQKVQVERKRENEARERTS